MFNSNKPKESKSSSIVPQSTSHSLNSIVEGTIVEGDVKTQNDIRIDGALVGTLDCQGRVIIGPKGKIEGDIQCSNALIEGSFNGLLSVSDTLTVNESAKIAGDINTDKLIVHSGAVFNVACNMGVKSKQKQNLNKPVFKPGSGKEYKKNKPEEVISFVETMPPKK